MLRQRLGYRASRTGWNFTGWTYAGLIAKFAIAASSTNDPGGPLCVNIAVPVR
jgi:hypothetical protein